MIEKTKVEKTIMLFDKYQISKVESNLEKEKTRDALTNFMLSLDKNEIIDICALMELGRAGEIDDANFKNIKYDCCERYEDTEKGIIINHLLSKRTFSKHLRNSLGIYPPAVFSF